jgi:roadblock/LC7 domain-containing protein
VRPKPFERTLQKTIEADRHRRGGTFSDHKYTPETGFAATCGAYEPAAIKGNEGLSEATNET